MAIPVAPLRQPRLTRVPKRLPIQSQVQHDQECSELRLPGRHCGRFSQLGGARQIPRGWEHSVHAQAKPGMAEISAPGSSARQPRLLWRTTLVRGSSSGPSQRKRTSSAGSRRSSLPSCQEGSTSSSLTVASWVSRGIPSFKPPPRRLPTGSNERSPVSMMQTQ